MRKYSTYRLAAQAIERRTEHYCCHAIISKSKRSPGHFRFLFMPRSNKVSICFMAYDKGTVDSKQLSPEEARNRRVLALCFMAAMEEAGDI